MKTKKTRLIATVMMLLVTLSASARFNAAKQDAPNAYIGIRAGVGVSTYYNIDDSRALATPIGGVAIGFKVAKLPLYLETGAYYQNMGSKFKDYWYDKYHYSTNRHSDGHFGPSDGHFGYNDHDTYKVNNHSVIVPLVVTYHLYANDNITIQPFAGFYGSYGFDSEKMDFGIREGIGFCFSHLYVSVGANLGFVEQNVANNNTWVEDGQHLSLFFAVGVNF